MHELPGRFDHRSDKTVPLTERYHPVHSVRLAPDGVLRKLLDGARTIQVNSLHAQAIDRLAEGLAVEALASDGTI